MSDKFAAYFAICSVAVLLALLIMGPRRVLRTSSIVRWYLFVFVLTYLLRPLGSQWWGDSFLYDWLGLDGFDPYWAQITLAVALAIISFAVGYCLARTVHPETTIRPDAATARRLLRTKKFCAWAFIIAGYASIPLAARSGGTVVNDPYTGFGFYQGTSFYLTNANILSSSGAVLLYAITGRIGLVALAATPWVAMKAAMGWQRSDMLGFLFALMGVQAIRKSAGSGKVGYVQRLILVTALGLAGLVVFPLLTLSRNHFAHGMSIADLAKAADMETALPLWFKSASDIQGFETSIYHLQQSEGHLYASDYVYYFLFEPIPRVIWQEKPLPNTLATNWFGYDISAHDQGWSPGSIGEAVREFGWLGIPLLFCFDGWLLRKIELWVARNPADVDRQVIFASFYWLIPVMGRNLLVTLVAVGWMFEFLPVVMVLWYLNRRSRLSILARRWMLHDESAGSTPVPLSSPAII